MNQTPIAFLKGRWPHFLHWLRWRLAMFSPRLAPCPHCHAGVKMVREMARYVGGGERVVWRVVCPRCDWNIDHAYSEGLARAAWDLRVRSAIYWRRQRGKKKETG